MRRNFTTTFLLALVFLLGNSIAKAQPAEVWNISPDWNAGNVKRGIAYNVLNNHLYVAGNHGDANIAADNRIHILNAFDGSLLDSLTLEPLALASNGYGIRDVAVSNDGGILASITTTNAFNPQKLYYWSDENADPILLWDDKSGTDIDFGPGLDVYGDLTDDALIIIPFYDEAKVYYFEVVDGIISDPVTLTLTGVAGGLHPWVQALGTNISDGFWYNNAALNQPTLISGTGNITGAIPAGVFSGATSDVKQFMVGAMTYLAVGEDGGVQIINITDKAVDFSDVTAADSVTEISGTPGEAPGWPGEIGIGNELAALGLPDSSYVIYSLSTNNYVKANATEGAPFATSVMLNGFAMVDSTVNISYQYVDINGDIEGATEIKWYLSDDEAGNNIQEIAANQDNLSYTIAGADVGKYLSYSVLPVASSGTASDPLHMYESALIGPLAPADARYPEASLVVITGPIAVDEVLQGSYTYFDENGDLEGESILKWYAADDALGTNMVEVADGSLEYRVKPADDNKFILFSVTPVAETGVLLEGETVSVASDSAVFFPELLPTASDVTITGREEVAGILTGSYTYTDLNDDPEGSTLMKWYSADDPDGAKTELAVDTNRYEVQPADLGKYIFFGVTPVTEAAESGVEVFDTTGVITAEPDPEAPVANNVMLHGDPEVGVVLYGSYEYADRTDDPEGATIFKWYTADDASGANPTEIAGANEYTLLVTEDLIGKFIIFEVTPVATVGGLLVGDPVQDTTATAAIASTNLSDFERIWIRAAKANATPAYIGTGSTERGFAVGEDHIYIASRLGGTNLVVADKTDGSLVGMMNTEGMDVGLFKISDVEISDDGQILACPLQINASAEPFVIYKWTDELAAPTKFIEFSPAEAMRLGDKFTVVGDVSGDAIITAAVSAGNKVVRWVITGGIPDAGTVVTLANTTSIGSTPAAYPFSVSANADLLIDGRGAQAQVFDKDGAYKYAIEGVGQSNNQSNSPNVFYYQGRTMAAFHQKNESGSWDAVVKDITSPANQTVVGTTETLSDANQELGGVHVEVTDTSFRLFMLSANNGIGLWEGTLEFPAYEYSETSLFGDTVFVRFSKNMPAEGVSEEGWTILADDVNIVIDTLTGEGTDDNVLSFVLETPIGEGQTVTIAYDGAGSTAAFDATPLTAFGPEAVVNIVGADAPVATNVTLTGDVEPGAIVTGTYTFNDPDGDAEGNSLYQWYVATNAEGSDALKILGEKSIDYTITNEMDNKYIAFEVTPVSETGGEDFLVGDPVMSEFVLVTTVGIDATFAQNVKLYPNPVANELSITNAGEISKVHVINMTGKVVMNVNTTSSQIKIDVSSLDDGLYIVKMMGDNGKTKLERIVKSNR